ncbi:MAG: hypothetical protein CM1200mP39_06810 [Dehalococcoidia bacterium]|nr:MAG: hypothetical protein CM1200mP39_06810 [Dehalococcoidia bacterium]
MKPLTINFRSKAAQTIGDEQVQNSLEHVYTGFYQGRINAAADTPNWEELRTKGKAIKDHTIAHLDHYLDIFQQKGLNKAVEPCFSPITLKKLANTLPN